MTTLISDLYIAEYKTGPLRDAYRQQKKKYTEDVTRVLEESTAFTESEQAEMYAEDIVSEVFGDMLEQIDGSGRALWAESVDFDKVPFNPSFPIYQKSPVGVFNSVEPKMITGDRSDVSDEFMQSLAVLTDDEETDWGAVPEDIFNAMSTFEQEVVLRTRDSILGGTPPREVIMMLEFAEEQVQENE